MAGAAVVLARALLLVALAAASDPAVVYRTWHTGSRCSSAVTAYETDPAFPLGGCSALLTDLGNPKGHVRYLCMAGVSKYTLSQLNFDEFDTTCSQEPLSTDVVEHTSTCLHDLKTGYWVKTHCGPLPATLTTPAQLIVKDFDDATCSGTATTEAADPRQSTRNLLLGVCQPVFNTAPAASGRKKQNGVGEVLYYRKVTYKSGPVGAAPATWDAGISVTGVVAPLPAEGAVGTAVGPLTLLVERFKFEDKDCLDAVKYVSSVQYTVQAATTADNQCRPDPLFPSKFYHVAAPPVPSASPTALPTNPTAVPTVRPTRAPTRPTTPPTPVPSILPSSRPTVMPSPAPTPVPTFRPSPAPTAPTPAPTVVTTSSPTNQVLSYSPWLTATAATVGTFSSVSDVRQVVISSATFGGSWVGDGAAFVLQVPTYAKNQLTLASPKTALQYYACLIAGQLKCVTMEVSVATGGVVQLKAVEAWYDSSAVVVTNPASPYIVYDKFLNAKTPAPLATSAPDPGYGVSAVGGYILSTNQQYFDTSSAYLTTTSPGALLGACSDARTVVITNAVMGGGGGAGGAGGAGSGGAGGTAGTGGAAVDTYSTWGSLSGLMTACSNCVGSGGYIAGGGGGGAWGGSTNAPGGGGGAGSGSKSGVGYGQATAGSPATASSGSGGGGGPDYNTGGGAGGSGFVVVRYPIYP